MLAENTGQGDEERALAAVAFADVVNFSAMMAADERRTFEAVHALLHQVVAPQVGMHRGAVVKWTGDGLLARFGSALDAVRWGEAVQVAAAGAQAGPSGAPILLRIAINLGDVIFRADDIFGDGVNVAARLLEHSPPGGVALSEAVYDAVRGSVADRVTDLGLRSLKSFAQPARVFALMPAGGPIPMLPGDAAVPSIAVLPLENLGGDSTDDYFADGVVEDIIVSLAGLGELLVVSRASTLAFAGRRADPREVGRALGVRYVVTGSVRRSPRSIRVGTQLCETASGRAIWTETAEASPGDLFDMQDRIVEKIVTGIAPNVRASELRRAMRKHPNSFSAYDHTLQALHLMHQLEDEALRSAGERLHAALREDPSFAMPHAWLAWWYMLGIGQMRSGRNESDMLMAGQHAQRATELDANNGLALAVYGHVKSFLFHQYDIGLMLLRRAITVSPSSAMAWCLSAASLAYTGEVDQALRHAERGLRLSPLDRNLFVTYNILCLAHYQAGNFPEAITWGKLSLQENPKYTSTYRWLMASLVAAGELQEAREIGRDMLSLMPDFDLAAWRRTLQPFRDHDAAQNLENRLKQALSLK